MRLTIGVWAVFFLNVLGWSAEKPNIVFFLADDLGWTGLNCFGSDFYETPNLDALADRGVKLTQAYSACTVCSPTRGALMTGYSPARSNLTDFIAGQNRKYAKMKIPDWNKGLKKDYITIAEALKAGGYRTGQIGKWHLDYPDEALGPKAHGFDVAYDKPPGTKGYYIKNAKPGEASYVTDDLANQAVQFIESEEDKEKPFFLYFAFHVPHTPIQGREDLVNQFKEKVDQEKVHHNPIYAAMVKSMDMAVGKVLDSLKKMGMSEKTIVIFTSDNGGLTQRNGKHDGFTENKPLRRGKGSAYEGGVRVPGIVFWPGVTPAGKVCHTPVTTVDFYPTLLSASGVKGDSVHNANLDGMDLTSVLRQPGERMSRDLYWHYPHYHAGGDWPYSSIRSGSYRLVESLEDGHLELYDLSGDVSEAKDLSKQMPEKVKDLKSKLDRWRESVSAQMPTQNPDYDPARERDVVKTKRKK